MTTLTLSSRRIFWTLFLISFLVYCLDLGIYYGHWIHDKDLSELFDITLEANLPTWFSSAQFVVTGLVAWLIRKQSQSMGNSRVAMVWLWIALFFLYDGIDDAAQIHERMGTAFGHLAREYAQNSTLANKVLHYPSYYWQLCLGPFFVGFGLYMAYFLNRELSFRLKIVFLSAMVCYTCKIGLDVIEGASRLEFFSVPTGLTFKEAQHLFRATEELTKMLGTTLILGTFLEHLRLLVEQAAHSFELRLGA
ncbi:MAG: hypothetical protein HQL64_00265 [Magnetococcales bacterium]|nr:hypothetical protein [Magnetococcales bacterium]